MSEMLSRPAAQKEGAEARDGRRRAARVRARRRGQADRHGRGQARSAAPGRRARDHLHRRDRQDRDRAKAAASTSRARACSATSCRSSKAARSTTKYGPLATDHVLFVAAGAFHMSKPSDLIPELQGRFPIRVELDSLTAADFETILTQPKNALMTQYTALARRRRRAAGHPARRDRRDRPDRDRGQRARREHRRAAPAHGFGARFRGDRVCGAGSRRDGDDRRRLRRRTAGRDRLPAPTSPTSSSNSHSRRHHSCPIASLAARSSRCSPVSRSPLRPPPPSLPPPTTRAAPRPSTSTRPSPARRAEVQRLHALQSPGVVQARQGQDQPQRLLHRLRPQSQLGGSGFDSRPGRRDTTREMFVYGFGYFGFFSWAISRRRADSLP